MPLRLTLASPADLDSIVFLMRQMQAVDPWSEPFIENTVRSNLQELLTNSAYGLVYLARVAGCPVAYLVLCFDYSLEYRGKGAWIDELYVADSHCGQGIGSRLLDLAERACLEHKAHFLHLEVSHGNPAIELYRRRGFLDHQRYLMTKRLAP